MTAINQLRNVILTLGMLSFCYSPLYLAAQAAPNVGSGTSPQKNNAATDAAEQAGSLQPQRTGSTQDSLGQPGAGIKVSESSASKTSADDASNPPTILGFQTRVLKEGEKVPERKDPDYEDWSKPELTPGMRMESVPLGVNNGDGFTRELLTVQWREMDPIDLWIVRPTSVKNPPVILYLYSYNGSNQRYKNDEFCKGLIKDGFAAVGFVSALTEQRFHDRPLRQTYVSQLQESLGTTTHDVQMILNLLEKRGDLDMTRVGMWADGSGASVAIMAAAVDGRINALDLLDPWGDWPDWFSKSTLVPNESRSLYLTPQFLGLIQDLDPLKWLPTLKTPKIRLQYIDDGISVTPASARERMETAAPPQAETVHYQNAQAFMSQVASKGIGFDWIKRNTTSPHVHGFPANAKVSQGLKNSGAR